MGLCLLTSPLSFTFKVQARIASDLNYFQNLKTEHALSLSFPTHIHPAYAFQNVLINKLSYHSFIKNLLIFSTTYEIKPTLWLS